MTADYSTKTRDLLERLRAFFDQHIYPNEERYLREVDANRRAGNAWIPSAVIDELKPIARREGLWNLFLPHPYEGQGGISNLDYAPLCELMGRVMWSGEVFNCSAPDTGNMETLERYATDAQKQRWLRPLLDGEIRSAFLMTEPAVASSDATNIQCTIRREGDDYVINGRKWFSSGAGNPRCAVFIVMGKTDASAPRHAQQSMVLVPRDVSGVTVLRPLTVFGYDDAPHGHMEVVLDNVRVPASSLLLGEGRGFEIAQGRLGPGRIHHCMHSIGAPLQPGMIVSNEPGYYKPGAYGIRIENLQFVTEAVIPKGGERAMHGFENLTWAPIDRNLIEVAMLSPAERAYMDAYHAEVLAKVGPLVKSEVKAWLDTICAPL